MTPFNTETSISPEESNYYGHYPYEIEDNYFSQENLSTKPGEYRQTTVAVDSFSPNAWGLYNMHGNVSQWVGDYYAGPQLLDRLLTEHPEVDFVQLQINYADWNDPNVSSRANYEVARKHGKSITVMEPVKGGKLANPPAAVKKLFQEYAPDMSPASWAIRFVASLDGIITVLSGMSSVEQMEDNLSHMKNFQALNEEEQKIIRQAQKILGSPAEIPCTACHYCTDGCPKQIQIPDIFAAANLQIGNGQATQAKERYASISEGHRATDCIGCKQCERACPQHLKITDYLKQCSEIFGA